MKRIFGPEALHLLPMPGGFIMATQQNAYDDKVVVAYKMVNFESGSMNPVTRNVYLLTKFGNNFKACEKQLRDYLNCKTAMLDEGRLFAVYPDGTAKILDKDARVEWQGALKYRDYGPADAVVHGHTLWASFPENNALIRFNLRTMREELRIGGGSGSAFSAPEGLWVADGDNMLVCNPGNQKILEVNLKSYTVYDYAEFEEPVRQYIKIGGSEIVLLDSGVYRL